MKKESDLLAELKENLNWYRRIELEHEFHELKRAEIGAAVGPGRPHKKVWGLRQSADILELSYGGLCEDIFLYRIINKLAPELKKLHAKKEALKEAKEKWWGKK